MWEGSSYLFNRMWKHAELARGQVRWVISDGQSVRVLEDTWVGVLPLRAWPATINMEVNLQETRVSDYITPLRGWNIELIKLHFGGDRADKVCSTLLAVRRGEDTLGWGSIGSVHVSIGDLYGLAAGDTHCRPGRSLRMGLEQKDHS